MASTPQDLADLQGATASDLIEAESEFEANMRQVLAPQGLEFLDTFGIVKEEYGGLPAFSFRYRRSGPNGPVIVDLIQIWRLDAVVRINLAYREAEAGLWKVVITRIKGSIIVN